MSLATTTPAWRPWVRGIIAIALLGPCLWGFGSKFSELVAICRGDVDGAFAISPILNYLLASAGFLLLLGWGAVNGMFRDVELPKYTMLANEEKLDAMEKEV